MDPTAMTVALVALAGTMGAAIVAAQVNLHRRVSGLENRNARLWAYCRKLIDHIYRGGGPPPPRPDDLDDLFPEGLPA